MYRVVIYFFLPLINGLITVQIHRQALFYSNSSCSFIRNISLSNDSSMQTCIWECQYQNDCQTAVYYHDLKKCSMYSDVCREGRIEPSGSVRSSVICNEKNHKTMRTCSSISTISDTETSTSPTSMTTVTPPPIHIFWSFDNNYNDLYNVYNGNGINNPSFHSPGYTGNESALALNRSSMQYVLISNFLNITYRSFTWEMWAYPTHLNDYDNVMVGMCDYPTIGRCLYLMIRNHSTYFAFWGNDCWGKTIIDVNQWHHFAFVYNYTARTQYIYLNGYLECQHNASGPFLGNLGDIIIGAISIRHTDNSNSSASLYSYWTGYIDQVSYISRAKTSDEILTDATLVAYYSFDNASFYDLGPNKINGTDVNISSVHGRVNEGILFNNTQAYFQADGFTLLGSSYRSYSIALWIYKFSSTNGNGTILSMSAMYNNVNGLPWCLPIIGLTTIDEIVGQNWNGGAISVIGPILPLDVWTHVVTSYSPNTGVSLWVNGTFIRSSGAFIYAASNVPNTVTLGSLLPGLSVCASGSVYAGQFYGMMDELRIYSRELNASEIYALANP